MERADIKRRMSNLHDLLLWEGRLNNGRLRYLFGMSAVRASEWIRQFRDVNPTLLTWNTVEKSYLATPAAHRRKKSASTNVLIAQSLNRYIALVDAPDITDELEGNTPLISGLPAFSTPDPAIFSVLSESIRTRCEAEITYMSMNHPAPHARIISPHHIVKAGRRWHSRAYCHHTQSFRDFSFGRMTDAKLLKSKATMQAKDDADWNAQVRVRLIAHPDLTPAQENVIRYEYFSNTASRTDTMRGALIGYYIQETRAAMDTDRQKPPDYQLAVDNMNEVSKWVFPE